MKPLTTLAAVGLSALLTSPVVARPVDLSGLTIAPNAETFTLDNGLEVVVIPDRRAPVVTHMVWYRVGSADEPAGKSGIAHYLEHLMFKGTDTHPAGEFSGVVSRIGGRENAFTSNDYTAYFQQVSRDNLRQMMEFEADRMKNLALTPEVALPELKVIQEERNMRVETQPSAELGEAVDSALYVNHPYGDPVIGWANEIADLTFEDALSFYRDFYRPGNAVLVIAGDVSVDEIRTLAAETYGAIADDEPPLERNRPEAQRLDADRTIELRDARVNQPSTQVNWLVPSYNTAEPREAEALDVLAEILGGTNTSRLYTAMVRDEGIATSAGAWYQSSAVDDTRFVVYAVPSEGVELAVLETRLREILADLARDGVTDAELARAKTSLLASVIFAQDSQNSLARIFGSALTTGSTVADVQEWPSRIAAVTADEVRDAARTFLQTTGSVTARLLEAEPAAVAVQ